MNKNLSKKAVSGLIDAVYRRLGLKATVIFADQLMYAGFLVFHEGGYFNRESTIW